MHTDECYISETPVCGKDEVAHTDACYTWTETTYGYYTVTFVPNNGTVDAPAEDIRARGFGGA